MTHQTKSHVEPTERTAPGAGDAPPTIKLQDVAKYQQITWTLKVEGDVFKVPDLKSKGINVGGSFQAPVSIPKAAANGDASETAIPLKDALPSPAAQRVIAVILKLDDTNPKDMKPLKVSDGSGKKPRELGMDAAKNPLVYFLKIPGFETPDGLSVKNENCFDVKLSVNLAYGPNP